MLLDKNENQKEKKNVIKNKDLMNKNKKSFLGILKNRNMIGSIVVLSILYFSKFLEIWDLIDPALALTFLEIIMSILIFNIRSTRLSEGFLEGHRAKPCQLDHFGVAVHHFVRAQVCPA